MLLKGRVPCLLLVYSLSSTLPQHYCSLTAEITSSTHLQTLASIRDICMGDRVSIGIGQGLIEPMARLQTPMKYSDSNSRVIMRPWLDSGLSKVGKP